MPGQIPAYQEWMDTTAVSWRVRGLKLRAVDDALKAYWASGAQKSKQAPLRRALDEWIGDLGANWQSHERNVNQIVSLLRATLHEQPQFTPEDIVAFQFQDEMRRRRMARIFRGKQIVWKAFSNTGEGVRKALDRLEDVKRGNGGKLDDDQEELRQRLQTRQTYEPGKWNAMRGVVNGAGTPALNIAKLADSGAGASQAAGSFGLNGAGEFKNLVGELFGGHSIKDVDFHLLRETGIGVDGMAASVTPIVSNIASGVNMVIAWTKAAKAVYNRRETGSQKSFVASGDIGQAFEALQELLERKVKAETIAASIQTADFAARTAASFADGGAVSGSLIGAVSSLSKLVHKLYLLGREYVETRAARALLDTRVIDGRLFNAYPLMGCYMLACSDLSEIIVMTRNEQAKQGVLFGAAGWMDDVEYIKKNHIDKVLLRAASFIYSSPFAMPNMPLHVAHNPDLFNKLSQWDGKFRFFSNGARLASALA